MVSAQTSGGHADAEFAHIVNASQLHWSLHRHGDAIAARTAPIAARVGARKLGYRLVELEPGMAAFPRHVHFANEEMFFILQGTGTLELGVRSLPVKEGDFIGIPAADQALDNRVLKPWA